MKPFKTSNINVSRPSTSPEVLRTFVAPIFLDPMLRGSSFLKIYEMTRPNGIDPHK